MLQEELLQALARNGTARDDERARARSSRSTSPARAIERLLFWVPQSGDIGMGVSILSYDGAGAVRPHHRRGLCPDPGEISKRFGPEFEKLVLTTLMAPWPREGDLDPRRGARGAASASVRLADRESRGASIARRRAQPAR